MGVFLITGAAVCVPPGAGAAERSLYVTAGAGAAYAPNGSFDGAGTHVDFDLGRPVGQLAVGVDPAGAWRFEVEASHRYNDAEVVFFDDGRGDVAPDGDSRIRALGLGASAIREFEIGRGFRPFLGAGVGVARIDYELREYITEVLLLDDDDTALTWQLVAGFGVDVTRRLTVGAEYRYWQAPDIDLESASGDAFDTAHEVHSVTVNARYALGGPRPQTGARAPAGLRSGGWYWRVAAGPTFAKDAEIKDNIANFDAFDTGSVTLAGLGYAFAGPWRLELEGSRRRNEAELVDFNPEFGEDRASGRVRADSLMVNALYEPELGAAVRPYVAVGAGMAWSDWDVTLDADGRTYVDDDDAAAAFQIAFGATAPLTERLAVTAEYRYWMTDLFDLAEPDGRPMRTELTVHSVTVGVRYAPGGG